MWKKKVVVAEDISIVDAVDYLSAVAEHEPTAEEMPTIDEIYGSVISVLNYLTAIHKRDKKTLKEREVQRGIKAMVQIAKEASQAIDKNSDIFAKTHGNVALVSKEFTHLFDFYRENIASRFKSEAKEEEDQWNEEWGMGGENTLEIERVGLKDLETVKRDQAYELFMIRNEEGKPYFNRNLLRHIRLVTNFDEMIGAFEGEDPLLKVKWVQDRERYRTAKEIIEANLNHFCQHALKFREIAMVKEMTKCLMGIMLASNERNLISNSIGKSAITYMRDALFYLREAISHADYTKALAQDPKDLDPMRRALIDLVHFVAYAVYTRLPDRGDAIDLIYKIIKMGNEGKDFAKKTKDRLHLLNSFLEYHRIFSEVFRKFPSGPLLKTLDIFREELIGFDPLLEENYPGKQFHFFTSTFNCHMTRLGVPVSQTRIDELHVIGEYLAFLRHLNHLKQTHLIINLQDRTSWQEFARCEAIEVIQKDAEFAHSSVCVTLPKHTDFYNQTNDYAEDVLATHLISQIKEQVKGGTECGFFFPSAVPKRELSSFMTKVLPLIHTHFFGKKRTLTHKNRCDFISIFYNFLILKILDIVKPQFASLMCKDMVDVGAAATGEFYLFLRLMSKDPSYSEEEKDNLIWMWMVPALLVRERPIDSDRLSRSISAITIMEEAILDNHSKIVKAFAPLFDAKTFNKLTLS